MRSPSTDALPRLVLVAGSTETAAVEGISAAGKAPSVMGHTPSVDAELVFYGRPVTTREVPVSPTGCPTPALITRAARETLGFEVATVDAGLAVPTAVPTTDVGASPGRDIRESVAVPGAEAIFGCARSIGTELADDRVLIGETIPGGTTTALAVLRALGEPATVSSSLPANPIDRKRTVVETALAASDLRPSECADQPLRALEAVGDPVLATVAGLTAGLADGGTAVVLAGGTQQLAASLLARHAGVEAPLSVATTSYVAGDDTAGVDDLADAADVKLEVTDPEFADESHPTANRYEAGEAKEGVGMGGALHLAAQAQRLPTVRRRVQRLYERLIETPTATDHGSR